MGSNGYLEPDWGPDAIPEEQEFCSSATGAFAWLQWLLQAAGLLSPLLTLVKPDSPAACMNVNGRPFIDSWISQSPSQGDSRQPAQRHSLHSSASPSLQTHSLVSHFHLVMEFADQGSLADAVKSDRFKLPNGQPNMVGEEVDATTWLATDTQQCALSPIGRLHQLTSPPSPIPYVLVCSHGSSRR